MVTSRLTRWMLPILAAGLLAACAETSSRVVVAGGMASDAIDPEILGRGHYESMCSNCHGHEAKGDGPLSSLLKIATPDLTRLAARNGGVFPRAQARRRIDGTEELVAHGTRVMPIWGSVLNPARGEGTAADRAVADRKIDHLVAYLESIQTLH